MNRKRSNTDSDQCAAGAGGPSAPLRKRVNRILLFELAAEGKLEEILNEVNDNSDLLVSDCDGRNLLHRATGVCYEKCDFERQEGLIRHLLTNAPQLTEEKNMEGQTPLCLACEKILYFEMVSLLIHTNPSTANMADDNGMTPLHHLGGRCFYCLEDREDDGIYTNKSECLDLARLLIQNGASVNAEDCTGMSPLHNTVAKKDWTGVDYDMEMIELLLLHGAEICTASGTNAISFANSTEQIKYLLERSTSDLNKTDRKGCTVLHNILAKGHEEAAIKLLLEHGARTEENFDWIQAVRNKNYGFEIVDLSLKNISNCDVNARDDFGYSLLMQYGTNHVNIQKLLDRGADASLLANNGTNALFTAIPENDAKAVQLLIDNGADPLAMDQDGRNILSLICESYILNFHRTYENPQELKLAEYLFSLPQFSPTSPPPKFTPNYHPQNIILKNFHKHTGSPYRSFDLLKLLLKSNCIDKTLLVQSSLNFTIKEYEFHSSLLEPISLVLHNSGSRSYMFDAVTKEAVHLMLDAGFTVNETPANCVTPLTVLLGTRIPQESEATNSDFDSVKEINELAKIFIQRGVNIKSMALRVWYTRGEEHSVYNRWPLRIEFLQQKFLLPDALFIAFLSNNLPLVHILLSYWVAPPMLLLIFSPQFNCSEANSWFRYLVQRGRVPHGTEMFQLLKQYVDDQLQPALENLEHNNIPKQFEKYQREPVSLKELSRCSVRMNLSHQIQCLDATLPALLADMCPPGLKNFLLMLEDECDKKEFQELDRVSEVESDKSDTEEMPLCV